MRLGPFILDNMEAILARWEDFAGSRLPAARHMDSLALRDHAENILRAVVLDLAQPQTREAQTEKSLGITENDFEARETAAQTHAVLRARSGFDINQLAAEYRALRASVLRQWLDSRPTAEVLDDVVRFNEAIDQALAESVSFFSVKVDESRNLLLGMLGHDLRNPLNVIQLTARYLGALNAGAEVSSAASRLIYSGQRMQALLNDLVDFNRANLGLGVSISPSDVDLKLALTDQLNEVRAAHPHVNIEFNASGDCRGVWDGTRLQQLLDNILVNAIKYGEPSRPVRVSLVGERFEVRVEVANQGPAIDPDALREIFKPLKRGPAAQKEQSAGDSLGLGLYIASEIARAHRGGIEARSDERETVFVVTLPRNISASPKNGGAGTDANKVQR